MMTAAKMTGASVAYYERNVNQARVGADLADYYGEHGEVAPSAFVTGHRSSDASASASALGVSTGDRLSAAQVEGWFSERPTAPGTDAALGTKLRADGVRGFDATTAAPKSVSLLWALGSEDEHRAVSEAHRAAVAAAVAYVSEHAAYTRQRVPGVSGVGITRADGVAGAMYEHRTSRAMDPHLHTHVLFSGKVLSEDGKWRALDGTSFYHELRAGGMIYQATLRAELTQSLGVYWGEVNPDTGMAELANIDRATVEAWSQRHTQIEAWLDGHELGAGAAASAVAQKTTRESKGEMSTTSELRAMWKEDARAQGINISALSQFPDREVEVRTAEPSTAEVLAAVGEHRSTWTRADLVEATAARMPVGADPSTVLERVEAIVSEALGEAISLEAPARSQARRDGLVREANGRPLDEREGSAKFTTPLTIQREADTLARAGAVAGLDVHPDLVPVEGLSNAQAEAMRGLVSSQSRASVLVAPAGTGKTHSLKAARAAWTVGGRNVVGLAPTGAAADLMIKEGATGEAETIATAFGRIQRGERVWSPGTVAVIDEAGMIGSSVFAALVEAAERDGARLVFVGDPNQLQAPGVASGLAGYLHDTLPDSVTLDEVWRQTDERERAATLGLRDGDAATVAEAVAWYSEHDRLHVGSTWSMVEAAWDAYRADIEAGREAIIMAPTWEVAEAISARTQAWRIERGDVDPTMGAATLGDTSKEGGRAEVAHVGDVIVSRQNDYKTETSAGSVVRTSHRWTVEQITPTGAHVSRVGAPDERVFLSSEYLSEHARLGYGVSVHTSQGATAERAHVVMDSARADRATAYVAMTRGKDGNTAYLIDDATAAVEANDPHRHTDQGESAPSPIQWTGSREEAAERLVSIIERDRRDQAAHTVLRQNVEAERQRQEREYGMENARDIEDAAKAGVTPEAEPTNAAQVEMNEAALREQIQRDYEARAAAYETGPEVGPGVEL